MEKIIIHSHISDLSYAFTVAQMAYKQFSVDRFREGESLLKRKYNYPDEVTALAIQRDKSVTIIVDTSICISELIEVEDNEFK